MTITATIVHQKIWEALHAKDSEGNNLYRYIVLTGSSRSSKTMSTIDCVDNYSRTQPHKRSTIWRDTKIDCRATVLNDMLGRLKATDRFWAGIKFHGTLGQLTYWNGSTVEIMGADEVTRVHGFGQHLAWFNEPYKIPEEVFNQIDQRTSDFVIIDWNPRMNHWIDKLYRNPRTIVIHSTFLDNPFCPENQRRKLLSYQPIKRSFLVSNKYINEFDVPKYDFDRNPLNFEKRHLAELRRCRDNEEMLTANIVNWDIYGLGVKAERPNRIFRWGTIKYSEYLKLDVPVYIGVDWGKVDAFGIVEVKYYDGSLYLHELNYLSENEWRERLSSIERQASNSSAEGFVSFLFKKLDINYNYDIICDSNRPLKIVALRENGWERAVAAVKKPGSILDGIDLLNNLKVYYTETSTNIAQEQELYSHKVDRLGTVLDEPEDLYNHLMDAVRYVALYLQQQGVISRV